MRSSVENTRPNTSHKRRRALDDHEQRPNRDRDKLQRLSLTEVGREYAEQFGREPDFSIGKEALIDLILNDRRKQDAPVFRFPP